MHKEETGLVNATSSSIELWRYIWTIGVAIMHFGYFNGFYIAVDFFFMLSGFLLHKSLHSKPNTEPHVVLLRRLQRLYPEYIFAFVCCLIFGLSYGLYANISLDVFVTDTVFELLLLQISHPHNFTINGITWYISALVICMPILCYGIRHMRKGYLWVVAPYSALIIYSFFAANWKHIDFGFVWLGNFNGGLLRGFAGLNLGVISHLIYTKLPNLKTKKQHNLLAVVELLLFAVTITYSLFYRQTIVDFLLIPVLFCGIIIAFKEKGFLHQLTNNKLVLYLGKISYSIYLIQGIANNLVAQLHISNKTVELIVFSDCTDCNGYDGASHMCVVDYRN